MDITLPVEGLLLSAPSAMSPFVFSSMSTWMGKRSDLSLIGSATKMKSCKTFAPRPPPNAYNHPSCCMFYKSVAVDDPQTVDGGVGFSRLHTYVVFMYHKERVCVHDSCFSEAMCPFAPNLLNRLSMNLFLAFVFGDCCGRNNHEVTPRLVRALDECMEHFGLWLSIRLLGRGPRAREMCLLPPMCGAYRPESLRV